MATIKSYTDVDQAKKLAEILPRESADMSYAILDFVDEDTGEIVSLEKISLGQPSDDDIPCWSLAALLGVFPKGINISTPKPINALSYCCWNQYDEIYADNPIDACYDMILKLHELNRL